MLVPRSWDIKESADVECIHAGKTIYLLTPEEVTSLPKETILIDIFGKESKAGDADLDTRFGFTAFGVLEPKEPIEREGPVKYHR